MTKEKLKLSIYAKRQYKFSGIVPRDIARNYFGALLVIAGADGKLEQEELKWLIEEQKLLGAPEEYLMALQVFDWKKAKLENLLESSQENFSPGTRKTLLYQALKTSQADREYHAKERKALWRAAKLLGIDEETVEAIEDLVEMERNVDEARQNLLGEDA